MQQDSASGALPLATPFSAPGQGIEHQDLFGQRARAREHFVTKGEKKFDSLTYTTVGYVANVLISIGALLAVERTKGGQEFLQKLVTGAKKKFPNMNPETIETVATKTFFLTGGFAVLAPMKWLEDAKTGLIKKWNKEFYGAAAETDPQIVQSQHELDAAPKQSWGSVFASRMLALVPFYLTVGALWTRESTLAKWTNPELRALSKDAIKEMKAVDPAKFSQIASKGIYVDRLIDSASRGMGKGFAKLTGNKEARGKIAQMEKDYPGTIRSSITPNGAHDPMHSTLPYYFISETITSAMVAWGVYALTRVLGPLIGKKPHAPAVAETPASQIVVPEPTQTQEAPAMPVQQTIPAPATLVQLNGLEHQQAVQAPAQAQLA